MPTPFTRDRFSWLAYFMLAFFGFFINAIGPITPYLKDELSLNYTVGSLHYTAFAFGILLVGLGGHQVIRRVGRGRSLWLGALGISAGVGMLIVGRSPAVTIGACFLMGVVGSLILIIVPSALTDLHQSNATQAISEANMMASLFALTAPLLVGWFAGLAGGWRLGLGLLALLPVVLRVVIGKVSAPAEASHPGNAGTAKAPLPGLFWVYWTALVLGVATEFCMLSWSSDYLKNSLGLAQNVAAQAVSLFLLGMILGRLLGSRLLKRFTAQSIVFFSAALGVAGFLLFWQGGSVALGLVGLFVTGLGTACLYPMILSLAMHSAKDNTVTAAARTTLASGIAILALPLTLGRLADAYGIQAAYGVVLALLVGVAGVIAVAGRGEECKVPQR